MYTTTARVLRVMLLYENIGPICEMSVIMKIDMAVSIFVTTFNTHTCSLFADTVNNSGYVARNYFTTK
jgi:hypothetical protein